MIANLTKIQRAAFIAKCSNPGMRAALSQEHAGWFLLPDNSGGLDSMKADALNLGAPNSIIEKGERGDNVF